MDLTKEQIRRKISWIYNLDFMEFDRIGDITFDDIRQLKCKTCNNKIDKNFQLERFDKNKPHDKSNCFAICKRCSKIDFI